MRLAALLPLTFAAALPAVAETPVLTVMTYSSFASEWGPGPAIETGFEAECGCDLRFLPAGDGAALLARVRLEGARSEGDVVLGLDTSLIAAAEATGLFAPHSQQLPKYLPIMWDNPTFTPFDWGWFAFVHDKTRHPAMPKNFEELAASDLKIVIQDPRASTPGLGLLYWVKAAYGARAPEIWAGLSDNILTVTAGWTESYDLFLKGEADAVLSYTTSPAYHLIAEGDASKAAALFEEGHYLQVEVAGLLKSSQQPELGQAFLRYLASPAVQEILPTSNWMYPVSLDKSALPEGMRDLPVPAKTLHFSAAEAHEQRNAVIEEWRAALSR